jgi:putative membrane protein
MPAFHLHLDVLGIIVALGIGYEYGIRRLAPRYCPSDERPVTVWQRVSFYAGLTLMFLVSTWPFHDIAEQRLFIFHMTEHLVIAFVAPPLLLLGTPWWLMRVVVSPIMPVVKVLTRPVVALVVFNAWLAFLHVPSVVVAMDTNSYFHFLAHTILFVTAIMMWWPVIDPIPDTHTLTPFGKMGYLFLQGIVPNIPASFMTLGTTPLYANYAEFPRLWGIDVMTDQIIAGLIMKIGGTLWLWGWIAWIWFSWYFEEQKYETGPTVVPADPSGRGTE